ncbi:transglutaminase [Alsobacter soli]|uniref:Transglutaminase n=1 Tax=Alsobacter soli TaxID=2109933 RepID=A0A2T1HRU9_9HYPH|nr:transglutaminase family protein [Alsobacter soli]PSC04373.1 transglutaminase [Alsobacter soli]
MRIRVSHHATYRFDPPAKSLIQTLRLTPRNHETQFVVNWRLDADVDGRLRPGEDAFGNATHVLSAAGPIEQLTVSVDGVVQTQDAAGLVRGAVERFPPALYLRETPLTVADEDVQAFAEEAVQGCGTDRLDVLHQLMGAIHEGVERTPATAVATSAAEALAAGTGDSAALSHLFVSCARFLGAPARVVSGYLWSPETQVVAQGGHRWAEAHVPGLGWVGFDTLNKLCPTASYIRIAVGLDELGAAPIRSSHTASGASPAFRLRIDAQEQSQS